MKIFHFLVILVLIGFTGCSWFQGSSVGSGGAPVAGKNQHVDFGRIIRPQELNKRAKIVFVPFLAGPGVEAGDELDKIAIMIADGFADILHDADSRLTLAADYHDAEFVIEGYVTEQTDPGKLASWMPGKDPISLGVRGEILSKKSGEVVAVFRHRKESAGKKISHRALGREIGRNIAEFLVSEL